MQCTVSGQSHRGQARTLASQALLATWAKSLYAISVNSWVRPQLTPTVPQGWAFLIPNPCLVVAECTGQVLETQLRGAGAGYNDFIGVWKVSRQPWGGSDCAMQGLPMPQGACSMGMQHMGTGLACHSLPWCICPFTTSVCISHHIFSVKTPPILCLHHTVCYTHPIFCTCMYHM